MDVAFLPFAQRVRNVKHMTGLVHSLQSILSFEADRVRLSQTPTVKLTHELDRRDLIS